MRVCTCLGTCRGAAGLAPGWVCALEMDAILAKHPADPMQEPPLTDDDEYCHCGELMNRHTMLTGCTNPLSMGRPPQ